MTNHNLSVGTNAFQHLPAAVGFVGKLLESEIEDFRLRDFESFGIHLSIRAAPLARAIHDIDGTWIGWNRYFFNPYTDVEKLMKVKINARGQVKILYMNQWRHISVYLQHVKPPVDWNATGQEPESESKLRGWEQQARWWSANGKKFRLLDLPPEIREIIYSHVFGPVIEPYPTAKVRRRGGTAHINLRQHAILSLLQTCRLVHKEASNILYSHTTCLVNHYCILKTFMADTQLRSRVRHLELSIHHDGFMCLFAERLENDGSMHYSRAAKALREMDLTKLTFTFSPPSVTTGSGQFDGACQKGAILWLLNCAWSFIRGHPVQLEGFVKNNQKRDFETACAIERKRVQLWQKQRAAIGLRKGTLSEFDAEIDDEEGGVILDEVEIPIFYETLRAEWEPQLECGCKVRCAPGYWTAED